MNCKSLFIQEGKNKERYTDVGTVLYQEAVTTIDELFQNYIAKGYSRREISLILLHAVFDTEAESIILLRTE